METLSCDTGDFCLYVGRALGKWMTRSHPEAREGSIAPPCRHTQGFQGSLRGSPFSRTGALPQANSLFLCSLWALQQKPRIGDLEGVTRSWWKCPGGRWPVLGPRPRGLYFLNGLSVNLLPGTTASCCHPSLLVSHSHCLAFPHCGLWRVCLQFLIELVFSLSWEVGGAVRQ